MSGDRRRPASPREGGRFGRYELLGELASGGMGTVFRARQVGLERTVALKVIRGAFADAVDIRRFALEAEATARVKHPHIVEIYDVGTVDDTPYYSMELIEGGTLETAQLTLRDAVGTVAKVARAIHHAHEHAILHRDLKPLNILVDGEGEPRVTDFGLACRTDLEPISSWERTRDGTLIGSAHYMSPEQASGDVRNITTASDVWGLGGILYFCVTGQRPFERPTLLELIEAVVLDEPVRPRVINPQIDADLEAVCLKCLEKKADRRYPSAEALAADLDHWLRGEPVGTRPISTLGRLWRWCLRKPFRAAVAGLLALLPGLLILGAVLHLGTRWSDVEQARARRTEILRANVYAARLAAGAVQRQFDQYGLKLLAVHGAQRQREVLLGNDVRAKEAVLDELLEAFGGVAASVFVIEGDGSLLARSPRSEKVLAAGDFAMRDYRLGALRRHREEGRPAPYVSKIYLGRTDARFKFGVAMALGPGPEAPVLVASFSAGRTIGVQDLSDDDRRGTLVCAYDGRVDARDHDVTHYVVLHASYADTEVRPVAATDARVLHTDFGRLRSRQVPGSSGERPYADPMGARDARYAGDWLVGVARIPGTAFTVLVQSRAGGLASAERAHARASELWRAFFVSVAVAMGFCGLILLPSRT